jgi:hypothetical protein
VLQNSVKKKKGISLDRSITLSSVIRAASDIPNFEFYTRQGHNTYTSYVIWHCIYKLLVVPLNTRWFKYDRDKLWLVYTQIVPVIFERPCTNRHVRELQNPLYQNSLFSSKAEVTKTEVPGHIHLLLTITVKIETPCHYDIWRNGAPRINLGTRQRWASLKIRPLYPRHPGADQQA